MPVPPDEFSRFAAASPPRAIPAAIRAAKLPAAPLWIAGLVAAAVVAGTWPLVAAVFPARLADDLRLDLGRPALAEGLVVAVEPTGRSLIRDEAGVAVERTVHRIGFRFTTADGTPVAASCHLADGLPEPGAAVRVEYLPGAPDVARIAGTSLSATPRFAAFVLALPLIGIAFLARVLAQRRRVRRLLVHGRFELAEIVAVREQRPTLGPARIAAELRGTDGDRLELDFDLARREGALLRARADGSRRLGLLRDPDRPRRVLWVDTMLAAAAEPAGDGDDEDPADEA